MVRAPTKLDDVVAVDVRRRFVISPSNREEQFRSIGIVQIGMCRLVKVVPSGHVIPFQKINGMCRSKIWVANFSLTLERRAMEGYCSWRSYATFMGSSGAVDDAPETYFGK